MGVRWQACWTVTTGDTVDWYEYDRCLRGFSYPLRKPATADCARSLARSPDAQAACSLPCCRGPAAARRAHPHSPGRPRRPGRMQSASTGSTATRHATPDSSLGRGVETSMKALLTAPRQRVSGSTEPVERQQTPGRLHRTRPLDESETAARAASRAARQPGSAPGLK